jgi:hypothetical protein
MATIIIKNSTGSGVVPSSLVQGELAINTKDGKLYYGSGSGNVVKEFTGSGGSGTTFPYTGSAIVSGSLTVTGSFFVSNSIDSVNKQLIDNGGIASVRWNSYRLYDSNDNLIIHWGTGNLFSGSFATSSVSWTDRVLRDSDGTVTIDWENGLFNDTAGNSSLDVNGKILYDAATNNSVEWENRLLSDNTGKGSIHWDRRELYDPAEVLSLEYELRNLVASDGTTVALDWAIPGTITLSGSLIPAGPYTSGTSSYDLGSATAAWRDLYVSNGSIKMISGSQSASISFTNGALDFGTTPISSPDVIATASVSSNTITFTKGDGSTFPITVDTGSGGSSQSIIERAALGYEYFNDFLLTLVANGATDGRGLASVFSGTGASLTLSPTPSVRASNQQGFLQFNTGTQATGYAGVVGTSVANNFLMLGGGVMTFVTSVFIPTLSTSTERFRVIAGYGSVSTNAAETNGVFFTYDEGGTQNGTTASPYWQCVTVAGGVRTLITTTVLASTTAWQKLTIQINDAANSVEFYIDNVLVATHSSNIPSGTSQLVTPKLQIAKAVGTTTRGYYSDYIGYEQTFTTPRI